uniref:Uncharacterized protein n=1 Tax=Phlebotomus papatasi TaxID=29031 RepID=A0A1B0DMM5_PHLPP
MNNDPRGENVKVVCSINPNILKELGLDAQIKSALEKATKQKALPQISASSKNATSIKLEPPERESFSSNKKIQVIKQETVDPNLATEILQRLPRSEAIKYTRIIEARQKVLQEQDVVFLDDVVVQGIENEPESFTGKGQEVVEELEVYEDGNTEANIVEEYIIEDTEEAAEESQECPDIIDLQESEEIVEDSGEVFEEILELPEQEIQEVVVESTVSAEDPDKSLVSESEESFIGFSGTENPEVPEHPENELQKDPALKDTGNIEASLSLSPVK